MVPVPPSIPAFTDLLFSRSSFPIHQTPVKVYGTPLYVHVHACSPILTACCLEHSDLVPLSYGRIHRTLVSTSTNFTAFSLPGSKLPTLPTTSNLLRYLRAINYMGFFGGRRFMEGTVSSDILWPGLARHDRILPHVVSSRIRRPLVL